MKETHIVICFLVVVLNSFTSCKGEYNRDHIIFNDSIKSVQDSIVELSHMMDCLSNGDVPGYFFDIDGYFYVNNKKLLQLKSEVNVNALDTSSIFKKFTPYEIKKFVSLVFFLKKNFISGAYKHGIYGLYFFDYHENIHGGFNDLREIIYIDSIMEKPLVSRNEQVNLLDQKGKLYLVSFTEKK